MALKDRLSTVPYVGTALRVSDRYALDRGNQLAAAVAFFGFLSLFPLVLLGVAVASLVVRGDPVLQAQIADAINGAVPGLGQAIDIPSIIANAGTIGVVGVLGLLWSGLKVVDSAQEGTSKVFRVTDPGNFLQRKVRSLVSLVTLGVLVLASTVLGSVAGGVDLPLLPRPAVQLLGLAVTAVLDTGLFLGAYRVLSVRKGPSLRQLLPGAVLAALGWAALKVYGAAFVARQMAGANPAYQTFAPVLAALLLLLLAARVYFYGAELAAVQAGIGPGPSVPTGDAPDTAAATPDPDPPTEEELVTTPDTPATPATAPPAAAPLPAAPRPDQASGAISPATAAALEVADARNARERDPHHVRRATAFVLAVGAVGGLARVLLGRDDAD